MSNRKRQVLISFLVAAIAWAGLLVKAEALNFAPNSEDPSSYENTADFSCGILEQPGVDTTSQDVTIVFHNPNAFPVMLNNYLSLNDDNLLIQPELSNRYLNVILSPQRYFEITCQDIGELFFPNDPGPQAGQRHFRGQIQSKSQRYLNIAFHYSRDTTNPVISVLE